MDKVVNISFWKNKKVLITGHTGFKGSWLSIWLHNMGAKICGISLEPNTEESIFNLANLSEIMDHNIIDIRDIKNVKKVFNSFEPEIIIHLAAQPLVRSSYEDPIETYSTNVMGTLNILEASRYNSNTKVILNITTDKCYENKEWTWSYREIDSLGGHDPYSSSKACSELLSQSYRKSFLTNSKISLATARAGNVIGGGDWSKDRIIPDILNSIKNNRNITLRNPNSIRPWQHVLEPLSGYLILCENMYVNQNKYSEAWNFGPNENEIKDVKAITELFIQAWGSEIKVTELKNNNDFHEANLLKLDNSKARNILNWTPKWGIYQTINKIVDWHKELDNGVDPRKICTKQINEFLN